LTPTNGRGGRCTIDRRPPTALAALLGLGACTSAGEAPTGPGSSASGATTPGEASPSITESPAFPIEAFADISEDPVSNEQAAELQAILDDIASANGAGMSATVMTADGTWSGATGSADRVRGVRADSQFGIASITKSVIAAQVMQMVETGELSLDAPAIDHLPKDLDFDTNGATIRQLLDMYSGIPDWYSDAMKERIATHRRREWATDEVLATVGPDRVPVDTEFNYADTNYTLLGLVIEHVSGRPVVDALRRGVLDVEGIERLVYQPDEAPTPPMAMPNGESRAALEKGGGYLPSLSDASSGGPAGAIASDSPSLAGWWRAFCSGELVSQDSLTEMSTFAGGPYGYGLGLFNVADPYDFAVGHSGANFGYVSWAGCLPEVGAVIVVLSNREFEDIGGMPAPLVDAVSRS
jgi:CubicO group peptidase (beta-lactamase class C family)